MSGRIIFQTFEVELWEEGKEGSDEEKQEWDDAEKEREILILPPLINSRF